jgi:hypothetical protein
MVEWGLSYVAKSSMTTTSTKVFTPCVNDKSKDIKDHTNNHGQWLEHGPFLNTCFNFETS